MASTLKAWQYAKSVTVVFSAHTSQRLRVGSLFQVFFLEHYNDFVDDILNVADRLTGRRVRGIENFTPRDGVHAIKFEDSVLYDIEEGITVLVKAKYCREGDHVELVFNFDEPGRSVAFMAKLKELWQTCADTIVDYEVVGEEVLWIEGVDSTDPIFARDGKTLLGERLHYSLERGHALCSIKPLSGETLVVYGSRASSNDIGLGQVASRLDHPIGDVFASIGPFSLQLMRDTSRSRWTKYDTIGVFEDKELPIKPYVRDEDSGDLSDDFDESPREDPEY